MTPRDLIATVAAAFDVTPADLTGPSRMRHIVLARHAAAWVLRKASPLSLEEIGRILGGRDHTTIGYSIAQVEQRIADDPMLRAQLHSLLPQAPLASVRSHRRLDSGMRWWLGVSRERWEVLTA